MICKIASFNETWKASIVYLQLDTSPPAKHALIRLPESLLSIPLSVALRNLVTACWQRAYEQVHSNATGLNDIICQAGFFDKDLANVLVHLVKTFIGMTSTILDLFELMPCKNVFVAEHPSYFSKHIPRFRCRLRNYTSA